MRITRNERATAAGSDMWFTEAVSVDTIATPGEDHWRGAPPRRFASHLSLVEVDDGSGATRGGHVSDEEYDAADASAER